MKLTELTARPVPSNKSNLPLHRIYTSYHVPRDAVESIRSSGEGDISCPPLTPPTDVSSVASEAEERWFTPFGEGGVARDRDDVIWAFRFWWRRNSLATPLRTLERSRSSKSFTTNKQVTNRKKRD